MTFIGKGNPRRYWHLAVSITCAFALYRVFVLMVTPMGLHGDEAQYWTWSLSPDFGYYSKPPMVAWIITLTTSMCGNSVFCIRLASPVIHACTGLLIFLIANRLYDERTGFWSSLAYGLMPGVSFYSVAITSDTPLLFFWSLALYGFLRALQENLWVWWLLTGAALGLGLLSKYTMLVFLGSVALYLLLSPECRSQLRWSRLCVAVGLAFVIYAPNIIWNARHGFVSYLHTQEVSRVEHSPVSLSAMLKFFGAQFYVFGPIFFALLLYLLVRASRQIKEDDKRLLLCFIAPWLIVILTVAFLSRAYANWSILVYIAGTVLVIGWLVHRGQYLWIRMSLVLHLLFAGLIYHYDSITNSLGIELTRGSDPFRQLRGWDVAGRTVAESLQRYPQATLLTNHRMTTALLLYYARPSDIVKWNPKGVIRDHYDLTAHMQGREGHDFLLVTESDEASVLPIAAYFESVEKQHQIRVPIHRDFELVLNVYLLRGFMGYY